MRESYIARVVNLIEDDSQALRGLTPDEARNRLADKGADGIKDLEGSFALVARVGKIVRMARSLDRPLRYFLAKEASGPMLIVADRIDAIAERLVEEGLADQFHPSYTRMIPCHHVTELQLVGCPDPNPVHHRFFDPPHGGLGTDLDLIGRAYVEAVAKDVNGWLESVPPDQPIGVLFSGGVDSGLVLLLLHHGILARGGNPARLKAFTLSVGHGGRDSLQAHRFLEQTGLSMYMEIVEVDEENVDPIRAVSVIEDYKPLDVECAAVQLALLEGIRDRYPTWSLLADGDGGDENLKDYPIEENPELTIRSVVTNRMLYHEGWGVDAVKHSLTYSGGLGRSCVRGHQPASRLGFQLYSPLKSPRVIDVSERIPFDELTGGSHQALYDLKGEVVARGVRAVLGMDMPVFEKRRFQHGAFARAASDQPTMHPESTYRTAFAALHG